MLQSQEDETTSEHSSGLQSSLDLNSARTFDSSDQLPPANLDMYSPKIVKGETYIKGVTEINSAWASMIMVQQSLEIEAEKLEQEK